MTAPTVVQPFGRPTAQIDNPNDRLHRRNLANVLQGAMQGHINCTLQVTLAVSVSTSTVIDSRISTQSAILMHPMTAHAAADVASGAMWFQQSDGQVIINHATNAYTDRTFQMAIIG